MVLLVGYVWRTMFSHQIKIVWKESVANASKANKWVSNTASRICYLEQTYLNNMLVRSLFYFFQNLKKFGRWKSSNEKKKAEEESDMTFFGHWNDVLIYYYVHFASQKRKTTTTGWWNRAPMYLCSTTDFDGNNPRTGPRWRQYDRLKKFNEYCGLREVKRRQWYFTFSINIGKKANVNLKKKKTSEILNSFPSIPPSVAAFSYFLIYFSEPVSWLFFSSYNIWITLILRNIILCIQYTYLWRAYEGNNSNNPVKAMVD